MMENMLYLSLPYTCCKIIYMENFSLKMHVLLGILSVGPLLISENNSWGYFVPCLKLWEKRRGWPDEEELKLYCTLKPALSLAFFSLSSISKLPIKIQLAKSCGLADHTALVFNYSTLPPLLENSHQFSSVAQSCPILCNPMDCRTPGLPVHHQLLGSTQTHVHWVSDAIQPSHPLSSPSPPTFNHSQNQGLFQWVSSSHQVSKVLEFQLQHQSFQRILRTDFL